MQNGSFARNCRQQGSLGNFKVKKFSCLDRLHHGVRGDLRCIGAVEFSYRKRHFHLTIIVDFHSHRVVWAGERKGAAALCPLSQLCYDPSMMTISMILLLLTGLSSASAAEPMSVDKFTVGVYGDDTRSVTCVSGSPGSIFQQVVWAWVPDELGLAYITLRFEFPVNLDLSRRPVFHDLVTDVIFTDYSEGTVEWNMIFDECPSGWIKVFSQEFVLLDEQLSRIGIRGADSMARDCTFVLNDVTVLNELIVNDPDCPVVPAVTATWGGIKSTYR